MKKIMATQKSDSGWEAISEYVIGETPNGLRILKFFTSKSPSQIDTCAHVFLREKVGESFRDISEIPGDFYKRRIAPVECHRATEKAVIKAHQQALTYKDEIIGQAKAFYDLKEIRENTA